MIFDYIKDKKIDKSVVYIENLSQEEVQNLYKNCDLFLMPSQYEIFGMVMLETMFFGLPIITTLNGGSSVLIENEKNGFIAELNDLTKWNDYICNVLNDENYHKVISQNAKKTISEEFVWNKLVNKYLMVYNDVYDKG